jgi:hypothetical protein
MGSAPVEIDTHRLVDMVAAGCTNAELCAAFGCAERTLNRWRMRNPEVNDRILALRGLSPSARRAKPRDLTQPHRPTANCYHRRKCPQQACRDAYNAYQNGRRRAARHPARHDIERYIALGWSVEGIAARLADQEVTVEVVRRIWEAWDREVGVSSMPVEAAA